MSAKRGSHTSPSWRATVIRHAQELALTVPLEMRLDVLKRYNDSDVINYLDRKRFPRFNRGKFSWVYMYGRGVRTREQVARMVKTLNDKCFWQEDYLSALIVFAHVVFRAQGDYQRVGYVADEEIRGINRERK